MPREQAGKFLGDWNIGADYDAFLYADVRDRLFFELPDARFDFADFMRKSGGVFLLLGIAAYWAASRLKGRVVQPRSTSDWKERGGSSRDE